MRQQIKFGPVIDAALVAAFVCLAVNFVGLMDPWLPIACGSACAVVLAGYSRRYRNYGFLVLLGASLLENPPWYLGAHTIALGVSGVLTSVALDRWEATKRFRFTLRMLQALPALLVVATMPVLAPFLSGKAPKRGIVDAGVWAKVNVLPMGQEALSTKHQYTYEQFRDALNAELIQPAHPLDGYDELILITPTTPLAPEFIKRLKAWTAGGGRLLIVADHTNLFGHQTVLTDLCNELGIALEPDAVFEIEANGGVYKNPTTRLAGLTPCSISRGVVPRLKMAGWSEHPDYTASSFFGDLDPTNDDKWGNYAVLGSRRVGLGEVSVFSDSTFFANFAINRWSSQVVLSSLFWPGVSSCIALVGLLALMIYLRRANLWILFVGNVLILISPSIGFSSHTSPPRSPVIRLQPPGDVSNNSEERDKGMASSLLASAYAFDLHIAWDKNAKQSFRDYIRAEGLELKPYSHSGSSSTWDGVPTFEIEEIVKGRFYVDQNSFWYAQGVGLVRYANMANCWIGLGGEDSVRSAELAVIGRSTTRLRGANGEIVEWEVTQLSDHWAVLGGRLVGRWLPEVSKWLVRKEWQLGPWLRKDLIFEPVQ